MGIICCGGCQREFAAHSSLSSHFSKTTNEPCLCFCDKQMAVQLHELFPSLYNAAPAPSTSGAACPSSSPPLHFDGDFFGMYTDDDFPWKDSDEPPAPNSAGEPHCKDSDSDSDDDDTSDGDRYSTRKHFKPPLSPSTPPQLPPLPDPLVVPPLLDPSVAPPPLPHRQGAAWPDVPPNGPTILKFMKGKAGAPVGVRVSTEYDKIHSQLNEFSPGNVYAPFKSEIDWKFAKWAKLRGPSSSAVCELLEMPGVSCDYYHYTSIHRANNLEVSPNARSLV